MPGWPSALLVGVAIAALWAACALIVFSGTSAASREQARHAAWLALLAIGGLTFPAVVRSFAGAIRVPRALFYFTGLGGPAVLAGVALWLAESRWKFTGLKTFMEAMPVSSFLFALNKTDPTPNALAAQGGIAVLMLVVAAWQSRGYWRQLETFEARDRAAAATAPVQ